jgi:hypothetical protein
MTHTGYRLPPKYRFLNLWTRLTRYEFWHTYAVYAPVIVYFITRMVRTGRYFWFDSVNPTMPHSGWQGESKWDIFQLMPSHFYPATWRIMPGMGAEELRGILSEKAIGFPIVAKPDVGERGYGIQMLYNPFQLKNFLAKCKEPYLLQNLSGWPLELGIFVYWVPENAGFRVSSVTGKGFLTVTGDGKRSLRQLMLADYRARMQVARLSQNPNLDLLLVPEAGQSLLLEPIGNHSRGTTFLNCNHMITEALHERMDVMCKEIRGFRYGRLDMRCKSLEDLLEGRNFDILEVNGASSEPGHVYAPNYGLLNAWRDLLLHWRLIWRISRTPYPVGR